MPPAQYPTMAIRYRRHTQTLMENKDSKRHMKGKITPIHLVVALCAAYMVSAGSCANMSTPPDGGPKDTIPPVLVASIPDSNARHVVREKTKLQFVFDEYVVLKDANVNVMMSPPQKKKPTLKIKGKSVLVTFSEPLDSARTYSLSLSNAIADNNEGNLLTSCNYSFSTGGTIDSMFCTGNILNYQTLYPEEGITVAFFKSKEDSALYKYYPDIVARSDKWGYFVARNMEPTEYSVYAFRDDNSNSRYDPYIEQAAFLDSAFTPVKVMADGLPELAFYDMKDTLACMYRPTEMEMVTFMEISPDQFIRASQRTDLRNMYIKFAAPYPQIDSMRFLNQGMDSVEILTECSPMKDSMSLWIKTADIMDSLRMSITYMATDSLKQLVSRTDTLKFNLPRELLKKLNEPKKFEKKKENEPREDLLKMEIKAEGDIVEQYGITIEFPAPLNAVNTDSISFRYKTPMLQEGDMTYTLERDTASLRKYRILTSEKYMPGYEYSLTFRTATFTDINGFTNDSTTKVISLPKDEKLSDMTVNARNVGNSIYIVDLVNEKRDKVLRSFTIDRDSILYFPYIKAGKYSIRISEDKNANGLFDTGDILRRLQPEKVRFYTLPDGSTVIDIKESLSIEQDLDIKATMDAPLSTGRKNSDSTSVSLSDITEAIGEIADIAGEVLQDADSAAVKEKSAEMAETLKNISSIKDSTEIQ